MFKNTYKQPAAVIKLQFPQAFQLHELLICKKHLMDNLITMSKVRKIVITTEKL